MKIFYNITIIFILAQACSCQEVRESNYVLQVVVVDEIGHPVKDASVQTSRLDLQKGTEFIGKMSLNPVVLTDETGMAQIEYKSIHHESGSPAPGALIVKNGWYSSTCKGEWPPESSINNNTYESNFRVVLKPIKNPIPMVFHSSIGLQLREIGNEYALDLELGEILPPYGKGKVPDILVKLEGQRIDNGPDQEEDIDFKATLRFSNPLDGFIEFEVEPKDGARGSILISDYLAPENGYRSSLVRIAVQGKFLNRNINAPYLLNLDRKAYYFRLRTKTDANNKIISSNYGKIYGPISLHHGKKRKVFHPTILEAGFSIKDVYFNPNSNDRNVECNTSKNLSNKADEYGNPINIDRP